MTPPAPSLKNACVDRLEEWILSGELQPGQRLPAERDLAAQMGVSRPVLHEALLDLATKGLVSIQPRHGVRVNDYRTSGSTAILASLLSYQQGKLDESFTQSLFAMRILVETETARLACSAASPDDLDRLNDLLSAEQNVAPGDVEALTGLDFEFHLRIALASGNRVYPLIINSFKNVYTHFTREFFQRAGTGPVVATVFNFHRRLVTAIATRRPSEAAEIMSAMLTHGEQYLKEKP
jgi:fatty acid metabolism transcriptional regulator FadR